MSDDTPDYPPMPAPRSETIDRLGNIIADELKDLTMAAEADLQEYGRALAADVIEASLAGRPDLVAAVRDQARMLAEIHRIRLDGAGYRVLDRVVDVGMTFAIAAVRKVGGVQ
jgi:hypothetical protein